VVEGEYFILYCCLHKDEHKGISGGCKNVQTEKVQNKKAQETNVWQAYCPTFEWEKMERKYYHAFCLNMNRNTILMGAKYVHTQKGQKKNVWNTKVQQRLLSNFLVWEGEYFTIHCCLNIDEQKEHSVPAKNYFLI